MKGRRVVITGMGAISALGVGVENNWKNAVAGVSGIRRISHFDPTGFPCEIAGEIPDFDAKDHLDGKFIKRNDRFVQVGMVAAMEAIEQSGLEQYSELDKSRVGTLIGAGIGGIETIEQTAKTFWEKGYRRVSPFYVPMSIINMISGQVSIRYGYRGLNMAIVTACSSSTHTIGVAGRSIAYGDADVVIAGGAESSITPVSIAGFGNAKALSHRNDDPQTASRPWDLGRDGFVMGEGAGIVVLEEYEHAIKRGATIYAELDGFGMSSDAHHVTAPLETGEGAAFCMANAIADAAIEAKQLDYINAHGTSTPQGDLAETKAIRKTFLEHADQLLVSSTKSMTGHLLGAAGGLEAVFSIKTINENIAPPTINLHQQDPACDLNYVANQPIKKTINYAMSNSFGFGGTNGSLVFSKISK